MWLRRIRLQKTIIPHRELLEATFPRSALTVPVSYHALLGVWSQSQITVPKWFCKCEEPLGHCEEPGSSSVQGQGGAQELNGEQGKNNGNDDLDDEDVVPLLNDKESLELN